MSRKSMRYIRNTKNTSWYISDIFQKDEDRHHFTKEALLYQDILKYSYDNPNFKRNKLDNWLVRDNLEFVNDYKDLSTRGVRYSTRIHAKKERIDCIFNNLIMAGLIEKSGTEPAEKQKRLEVDVHSSKKLGQLIWLVIKSMSLKNEIQQAKKEDNSELIQTKSEELSYDNQHIYELILSMIAKGKDATYKSTLLKVFVEKLNRRGLFDNFVNYLIEACNSTNTTIYDSSSLLSYVLDYMINVANNRSSFIDLWYESAIKLDPYSRRIFFYEILKRKLEVIYVIPKNLKNNWFANGANYNIIALEGDCEKCKQPNVITLLHKDHRYLIKASMISIS